MFLRRPNRGPLGRLATGAVVSLLLVASACSSDSSSTGDTSGGGGGTVSIGVSTALSGPAVNSGTSVVQAMQIAADHLNQDGGVLGSTVEVVARDDASDPQQGSTNIQGLIVRDGVTAVWAGQSSAVAAAQAQVASQHSTPIFYQAASDISLVTTNFTKYGFNFAPNSYMEPRSLALFLSQNDPPHRICTVGQDYSYGRNSVNYFQQALQDFDVDAEIVCQLWTPAAASDFNEFVTQVVSAKPDFVYTSLFGGQLVTFTKQATSYGLFQSANIAGPFTFDVLPAMGGQAPAGGLVPDRAPFFTDIPPFDSPAMQRFVDDYRARFGAWPTEYSVLTYASVQGWADAVERAGSFDGDGVVDALSGATVPTILGDIELRSCDHQGVMPMYIGEISPDVNPTYGFQTFSNTTKVDAEKIMMPCEQAESLQPK